MWGLLGAFSVWCIWCRRALRIGREYVVWVVCSVAVPWGLGCVCPVGCVRPRCAVGICRGVSFWVHLVSLYRSCFWCVWCRCAVGIGGWWRVEFVVQHRCVVSCYVLSCHVMSCLVVDKSCVTLVHLLASLLRSRRVMSRHVASCRVMSCRVASRRVISCSQESLTLVTLVCVFVYLLRSCRVMSCHVL